MIQDDVLLRFPSGLAGFPEAHEFRLYEPKDGYPLKFLQSTTQPELSFVCMDAAAIKVDYEVPLTDAEAALLDLKAPTDAMVLVLVVVPEDPRQMTANLAGPLVINTRSLTCCQVALDSHHYPLQYPVFASQEDLEITFPAGLVGFPEQRHFRLFEPAGGYPLKFLQSVKDPEVSFACIDVAAIQPNYEVPLAPEDAQALGLADSKEAMVLALVVIPEDPRNMTANLAGPLVINTRTRSGRQVILDTQRFPLKHRILGEA